MSRMIVAILSVAIMSASVSGCAGDLTPAEQNEAAERYNTTLQPGRGYHR